MESGRKDEVWLVTFFVLFVNNALPVDKDSIATVLVFVKDIYIYYIILYYIVLYCLFHFYRLEFMSMFIRGHAAVKPAQTQILRQLQNNMDNNIISDGPGY